MKVLLRKNVRKLGKIGEVVEVKSGYARNYLVPQGLAIQPSEAGLRQVEREKEAYLAELAKLREQIQVRANAVNGKEVTIPARANAEGHLYGSVGPAQIAAALAEIGLMVGADEIIMSDPLRELDKYDVKIEMDEEVTATVAVWVVPIRELDENGEEMLHPSEVVAEAPAQDVAEDATADEVVAEEVVIEEAPAE